MKFKESGDPFTAEEIAKMIPQEGGAFVPYQDNALRLYRKFVREFLYSEKLARAKRTGAVWHVDKKLKHVWKRYCGDDAYKQISDEQKRQIMAKALWDATGIHHPLEGVDVAEDYAKRESASLTSRFNPSTAEKVAVGLAEALADKGSLGVYKLVKIASHLQDGHRRLTVAEQYAQKYKGTGRGTDDLSFASMQSLDDDSALGVTAALIALKLERFTRREATLLAAQTLAVTGNALSGVVGVGQAISTASTVVSATVTAEQAFRNLAKRLEGNLGIARETAAFSLWGLGNRSHGPSLEFMVEMGLLDEEGYLRSAGFFDRPNMRLASNFIAAQIKSTGR
ncbi:MAG TPA: hypothetical protein VG963_00720 [Polyangiaceae bacterium]|nr:hypothetical protein [Polyangiaceae bacterium]